MAVSISEKEKTEKTKNLHPSRPRVVVLKTSPETVLEDYKTLLHRAEYTSYLAQDIPLLLKLNLSWTKFFPACSSPPWQVEGVIKTIIDDGFSRENIFPVENKTVVTNAREGCRQNRWESVLNKFNLTFVPLPEVKWVKFEFQEKLLVLNNMFPKGIEIPEMYLGKNILHLPTMKTHGHSITTGAVKNAFGGLLKEVRHYGHKHIHETLVDLLIMQKEIHPHIFAVMDGTVCGDGAGPRTMSPKIKNYILASADSVALDAVAAKMMGFNPMDIPYLRLATERDLGCADLKEIEVVGEDIQKVNFDFHVQRSLVIWGDQMLRRGPLQFLEKILLHSPLVFWAPLASNIYHDFIWYPLAGKPRIKEFMSSPWGKLFQQYSAP